MHDLRQKNEESVKIVKESDQNRKAQGTMIQPIIANAICFAVRAHDGQTRKGSDIPYITHPVEVALILAQMGAGDDLIAAGLLHDTLEDTDTTAEELEAAFGKNVLAIVESDSENKTLSWEERKQATLTLLPNEGREAQMLALADKLANMRSIAEDYATLGDALWKRFNRGYEQQKWYYTGLHAALGALRDLAAKNN